MGKLRDFRRFLRCDLICCCSSLLNLADEKIPFRKICDCSNASLSSDSKYNFYLTLLVFIGLEPERRTNKRSKGASRQISYPIKVIKTGQRWLRLTRYLNLESEVNRLHPSAPPRSYEDLKFTTAVSAKSIGRIDVPTCEAIVHALNY